MVVFLPRLVAAFPERPVPQREQGRRPLLICFSVRHTRPPTLHRNHGARTQSPENTVTYLIPSISMPYQVISTTQHKRRLLALLKVLEGLGDLLWSDCGGSSSGGDV